MRVRWGQAGVEGVVDMAAGFDDVCLGHCGPHARCHANRWLSYHDLHSRNSKHQPPTGTIMSAYESIAVRVFVSLITSLEILIAGHVGVAQEHPLV